MSNKPLVSVITATYNAGEVLPILIASLQAQTNKNFEWIVADGASNDNTLKLVQDVEDFKVILSSQQDFGIYDAINRAIKLSTSPYYLVMGADDSLNVDAIENIVDELSAGSLDVLVGQVESDEKLIKVHHGKKFFYGARAYVASHSVGCVFKKSLHEEYGYYSNAYPILADTYFIKKIFSNAKLRYKYSTKVFGQFSSNGISRNNGLKTQCEFAHIQLTTERFKFLQAILFFLRILKELVKG